MEEQLDKSCESIQSNAMITPTHLQAHFIFFTTHNTNGDKNKKSFQASAPDSADISGKLTRQTIGRKEARTDNSTYKKLALQWLNESIFRLLTDFVVAGSFRLRSRKLSGGQLLVAANRYKQA